MPDADKPEGENIPEDISDLVDAEDIEARRQERRKKQEGGENLRAEPDRNASIVGPDGEALSATDVEDKAKRKELVAQLLTRGVVNDRLDVRRHLGRHADPNRHYEWIRETDQDIERARSLGFRIERMPDDMKESEEQAESHETADDRIRLGDVILMSCPKDHHDLIQEVKDEQKEQRRDAEKREYLNKARRENPEVPVVNPNDVMTSS